MTIMGIATNEHHKYLNWNVLFMQQIGVVVTMEF